jgi:hypothetical protein
MTYEEKIIIDTIIDIIKVTDMARYAVGCLGVIFIIILEVSVEVEKNPWPDIISNQP